MKPATTKTELSPSTQPRKIVFGGSLKRIQTLLATLVLNGLLLTGLGLMLTTRAAAQITFDDLPETTSGISVTNGYAGLSWDNFYELDGISYNGGVNNGYSAGVVSPRNIALNAYGSPASITNATTEFNFVSAYLTAAWNDNLQVTVLGYAGSSLAYSNTYTLSATSPTLITFNYFGVTGVYFKSFGGTLHPGYNHSSTTHFVIDDVVISYPFTFTTDAGTITITGYTGSDSAVTIPSTIDGLPVTSIGYAAFQFSSLTSVTIPDSITNIADRAFRYCTSLTSITAGPSNSVYSSVNGVLFNKNQTTLVLCPGGKAGSYTIPGSVTNIGMHAFEYCINLTNITFPNSVTSIGYGAFRQCDSLANVTIGSGVTNIGSTAFYYCANLANVTIPSSVTSIGDMAFGDCPSLRRVNFQGNTPSLGWGVFSGVSFATAYYLAGTTGWDYFSDLPAVLWDPLVPFSYTTNSNMITVTGYIGMGGTESIPATITGLPVTSIGDYAFNAKHNLSGITIPNSVTNIGEGAFFSCTSLTNINISSNVTSIGDFVFADCYNLMAITVDVLNSAYSSVDGVLFNNSQTTLIGFPGGKTGGSYTISNSVTSIGNGAFVYCSSLTNITIPNSVTNIGYQAFSGCNNLNNVTIPNSVINIGDQAFFYSPSLTGVYFRGNAPDVGSFVFDGDENSTIYYLSGTTNWNATFGDRPTALWLPQVQISAASFGVRTNQFGFNVSWASGQTVVVDACTDLANPIWTPVQTNTLVSDSFYFSDSQWSNYPARLYRLRSP